MTTSSHTASSSDRPVFVPARIRLREEQVQPVASSEATPFGTSLGGLLWTAYLKAGAPAPKPPTETRTCKRSEDKHSVQWSNPLFGTLEISTDIFMGLGEVVSKGPNMCSHLYVTTQPPEIRLQLAVAATGFVRILHAKAGKVDEVTLTQVPDLVVPVKWNNDTPHTREKDMDNLDLVFINKDGQFVQLQVSLVTRKQRFWVCIQEIYAGQVVRTNFAKAKSLRVNFRQVGSHAGLIVPLYAEQAYPGADYIKSNPRMSGPVIEAAIDWGFVVPMGDAVVARWQPEKHELTPDLEQKGYQPAVVLWFNLVIGYGFALLADGQCCRVHFNSVVDADRQKVAEKGECPMLQAMKVIAVKHNGGEKPDASFIRIP